MIGKSDQWPLRSVSSAPTRCSCRAQLHPRRGGDAPLAAAFSALIGGLEATLGVRLFDRSKRHVAPTVEARTSKAAARRVLAEFDSADRRHARPGDAAPRPGLARAAALARRRLAAGVLARFSALYPGIAVDGRRRALRARASNG
jgi:DNA-binding transcriptional LysR family regulator